MEAAAIIIGAMAAAAVAAIKMHDMKAKRELEEKGAAVLTEVEERIERNRRLRENPKPAELDKWQVDFLDKMIKYMRKKEQEQKQLRKWYHYATHAKKRRTRKKYRNKLRKYYASKPIIPSGNWHYGSGAGLLPVPNPYTGKIDFRSMSETVRVPQIGARAACILPARRWPT